ncbi:MAG: hypothetical protein IJF41_05125 [Clostridia bacterium]|nr:hypothetical protein [Clostridia bacterium]
MHFLISNLRLPLSYGETELKKAAAGKAGLKPEQIRSLRLVRRSLDARKKEDIHYQAQVEITCDGAGEKLLKRGNNPSVKPHPKEKQAPLAIRRDSISGRCVVVGLGPGGLFAALELARYGFAPLVIERGRPVEQRVRDVEQYWETGKLNLSSNVMFGEGGAGTFSDGKLTSRSKDPRSGRVLELLYGAGAPEEILFEAKPHIGTDRLRQVVTGLREEIIALGGEVRFETALTDIRMEKGCLREVCILGPGGEEWIPCEHLVLAIGQGARDTVRMLHGRGIPMEKKPFAAGVRIEHPQKLINLAQYGPLADSPHLGAAEYRITAQAGDRGVYSFCMCPGGYVVASASGEEQVVVNGMSNLARDGENANAALVVQVRPEDVPEGPLGGIEFCEAMEKATFLAGGGKGKAPAERVSDFMKKRTPTGFGKVQPTYRPGVVPVDLWQVLPPFIAQALFEALPVFARQIRGFDLEDAILTAVESRTSAPYRILRGADLCSVGCSGLYPIGEGAGYAGGIVSSAIDGLKAAEAVITGTAPAKY